MLNELFYTSDKCILSIFSLCIVGERKLVTLFIM